jgi:hypothetical protein
VRQAFRRIRRKRQKGEEEVQKLKKQMKTEDERKMKEKKEEDNDMVGDKHVCFSKFEGRGGEAESEERESREKEEVGLKPGRNPAIAICHNKRATRRFLASSNFTNKPTTTTI